MRVVIQRVAQASVSVDELSYKSDIKKGLLIFLGVEESDEQEDIDWLVRKINNLRIFSDEMGKMNLSITQIGGEILVISQFTLYASTKKGNRPSFIQAAQAEKAKSYYEEVIASLKHYHLVVGSGIFGEDMQVTLVNDGPVTIIMDSKSRE